ncbi:MAG: hypothetical protein AAFZ65_14910 [Planctomycetota bacterium]
MSGLELLLTLGLPSLLGAALCVGVGLGPQRVGGLAFAGLAYALGAGAWGLWLWGWMLLELPLDRGLLAGSLLLLSAALGALARGRGEQPDVPDAPRSGGRLEGLLFAAVLTLACVNQVDRALVMNASPIASGDEAGQFYARARVIHEAGGVGAAYHEALDRRSFVNGKSSQTIVKHRDYPVLVPVLQVWSFVVADEVLWSDARVPIQAFSIALLLVAAGASRRVARPGVAALLVVGLASTRSFEVLSTDARPDLAAALGFLIAVSGLVAWRNGLAVGLGLGLAMFAKNEGVLAMLALYGALALVALLDRRAGWPHPRRAAVLAGSLPLWVFAATSAFNSIHGYTNDLAGANREGTSFLQLALERGSERIGPVADYLVFHVWLAPVEGRLLWVAALALVVATPALKRRPECRAPLVAVVLFLAGLTFVFLGTHFKIEWHLETAAARVAWQMLPALAVVVAALATAAFSPADSDDAHSQRATKNS